MNHHGVLFFLTFVDHEFTIIFIQYMQVLILKRLGNAWEIQMLILIILS